MSKFPKKFLITGGAGFIGYHLSKALLKKGSEVTVIDNLSTGSHQNIDDLKENPRYHFFIDTIDNAQLLEEEIKKSDFIFHLAAAVGVRLIVENPVHTITTNINGTEKVLKYSVKYRVPTFIASTSEVYGKSVQNEFNEEDDLILGATTKQRWSYACSKAIDEFLGLAYYHKYGHPIIIGRLFNTVGPRQTGQYGMVLPRFVSQALTGESITVYGDGSQTRCFTSVNDVVKILVELIQKKEAYGEVVNIGSNFEISIKNLAQKVKEMVGSSSEIVSVSYEKAYEKGFEDMKRRFPDMSKLKKIVGWVPETTLDTIIPEIVDEMKRG